MSDEVASATLQTSQKAIEVALELIKMLAPFAEKLLSEMYHKSVNGVNFVGGKIANARAAGTVSNKALIAEAQKAQSPISSTSNFLARDAERITEKAKEYKIPIAIIGNGEKQTVEFLDRDKAVMEQIFSEVMQERINGAPQSVKCFSVGENNAAAMKAAFEENGIECQFMGGKDGKVTCIYPAENAEQVAIIKEDYKKMHNEVAEHCQIAADIPETERMTEISARIEELKSAEIGSPMRSEIYDNTLSEMREKGVKFTEYSENNNRIIEREMPEAKQAAGKAFWESQGFKLNEAAKGIEIIAPETDDKGNPVLDENGKQSFTTTTVYDISETNAYEKAIDEDIDRLQNEYAAEKANAFVLSDKKEVAVSDGISGKSVKINLDGATKDSVSQTLQETLGYSPAKADLAANKLCYELDLDKAQYYKKPSQTDNLNALKTNIRYPSDDLTLRNVRYDAVNFKDGEDTHLILQNGDKSVGLTPAKMTEAEMKDLCVNELGLSEYQADKAVAKAVKIEGQVRSQIEERTVGKDGMSREIQIERHAENTFSVRLGDKTKAYNFTTINLDAKIAEDFNIPRENAKNIIGKAQKQSVLQNKIHNAAKKKAKTAPTAEAPKINTSKGLKRK